MDRRLNDRPVGTDADDVMEATTAPFPEWLDHDRGRPPTMLPVDDSLAAMPDALTDGFGKMVPSIYRCLAQWPSYFGRMWNDVEPLVHSEAFETASEEALMLTDTYLDRLPYTPRVDPQALTEMGFDDELITDLQDLFADFDTNGSELMPLLPVYAATVGASGERTGLTFPQ